MMTCSTTKKNVTREYTLKYMIKKKQYMRQVKS